MAEPETIQELIEEMVAHYNVPRPVVDYYAAKFIVYGAQSAVYRRETADAIAEHAKERGSVNHWPSGRIKTAGCRNG